jgi:hypothetical protein
LQNRAQKSEKNKPLRISKIDRSRFPEMKASETKFKNFNKFSGHQVHHRFRRHRRVHQRYHHQPAAQPAIGLAAQPAIGLAAQPATRQRHLSLFFQIKMLA